jgi:dihydrolipoamide dehydrogenase
MSDALSSQVVVIGAGPGGYACAFRAADLGRDVVLIDPEANPGGVCLYRGCIPSKAYLHVAALLSEARRAEHYGVHFEPPTVDTDRLRRWKSEIVEQLTSGLSSLAKARGVRFVRGRATFLDAHHLRVEGAGPERQEVRFEHAVIATGSRPAVVDALLPESGRVMTSTDALELADVPSRLLVVGGGYIGLELGTMYAALGSRVSVVELEDRLLPGADKELVRILEKALQQRFEAILTGTRVTALRESGEALLAQLAGKDGEREECFDRVLVAVGRRPNSSGLGLSTTRVGVDKRGFIETDASGRTAEPSVYAIGDVVGEPMLAHKATHQGLVAAEAMTGQAAAFEPNVIPAVVFTDPEVAWCGLSEEQAREAGLAVTAARFPWQASGRAKSLGNDSGLTKLIVDTESERVVGAGVVGPGAGEMIIEATLAIEMGALASDLAATVHPHPTLSETWMEAAEVFYGRSVHLYRRRRERSSR